MRENIELNQPQREVEVVQKREGLPVSAKNRPGLKFVYIHYPQAWIFDLKRGFIPRLSKIYAKPGVNGVDRNGDMTVTLAHVERKGGTVVQPKDVRLGEYKDYVHFYKTRTGGKWYVDFCQKAVVLPNDQIVWNDSELEEPMRDFAKHVLDCGIVKPILKEVYMQMAEAERAKLDNLYGRLDRNPHLKVKVDECEERIIAMDECWEKSEAPNFASAKKNKAIEPSRGVE
tara:strand:- start:494 stop:1180 length:687 start_codon:yes stop_codon:yes gene_type:complete